MRIAATELKRILDTAAASVERGIGVANLHLVRLDWWHGCLRATGRNRERASYAWTEVEDGDSVPVNCLILPNSLLSLIPSEGDVVLSLDGGELHVHAGRVKASIPTVAVESYPETDDPPNVAMWPMPSGLPETMKVAAQFCERPVAATALTGVYLSFGDGKACIMASNKSMVFSWSGPFDSPAEGHCLVSSPLSASLVGWDRLLVAPGKLWLSGEQMAASVQSMAADFPVGGVSGILLNAREKTTTWACRVPSRGMRDTLAKLSAFGRSENLYAVALDPGQDRLGLKLHKGDWRSYALETDLDYVSIIEARPDVSMDLTRMATIVGAIRTDSIEIHRPGDDPRTPLVFSAVGDTTVIVVAPLVKPAGDNASAPENA